MSHDVVIPEPQAFRDAREIREFMTRTGTQIRATVLEPTTPETCLSQLAGLVKELESGKIKRIPLADYMTELDAEIELPQQ